MKPDDTLDRRTVKQIQRFLEDERAKLEESVRRAIAERYTDGVARSADAAVWATETLHDEIQATLINRHHSQVVQIEAALERLARREYGICQDCGEFIGVARLRALPFTQRCRPCQSHAELQVGRTTRSVVVPVFAEAGDG